MSIDSTKATAKKYLQQMKFSTKRQSTTSSVDDEAVDADIYEMENFLVLRLPLDVADKVRNALENGGFEHGSKLSVNFVQQDLRRAIIRFDKRQFKAKLVDLPCIIEVLKTLDKKNFYKVADLSQMLICDVETENKSEDKKEISDKKKDKQHHWPHGVTPPLKNVRKRRFRKTLKKKYVDAPELDKELKRLLRADLEAAHVRYEVVVEDVEKNKEEGGSNIEITAGEIDQTAKVSSVQKPPEFSNFSQISFPLVSRNLRMTAKHDIAGLSAGTSSVSDDVKTDLVVFEAELNEIIREKEDLDNQVKSLDNPVLKERMYKEIKRLAADEKTKREELLQLKQQSGLT